MAIPKPTTLIRIVVSFLSLILLLSLVSCTSEKSSPTEPLPDVQLFGFVRAGGAGIADATVTLGSRSTTTDGSGLYRFTGLAAGPVSVTVTKSGYQNATKSITLETSSSNQLNFDLVPGSGTGVIRGDVKSDNAPLSGVTVTAGGSTAISAADGTFTLTGIPSGTLTLTAHKEGFNDAQLLAKAGDIVHIVLTPLTVSPASLSGSVRTSSGTPVAGASVAVEGQTALTQSDGTYSFPSLIAGSAVVRVTKTGFATYQQNVILVPGTNTLNVTLSETGAASLTGRVSSSSGAVSGATVSVQGRTATTAADGSYTVTGLNTGISTVSVSKSGFATSTQTITLVAGTNTLDVTLSESSTTSANVSGTITTSTGIGLQGATVTAQGKTTTSDVSGFYTLANLTPGATTVAASKVGYTGASRQLTLTAGDNSADFTLTATTVRATLSGTITLNGFPMQGVTVTAQGLSVLTDSNGLYQFADLATGATTVTTHVAGAQDTSQTVTLIGGDNTLDIALTASSSSALVSGTVSDGAQPLSGVTLTIQGKSTSTASDGTYLFTNLATGSSQITASKSGYQTLQKTIALQGGANALDITLTATAPTTAALTGTVTGPDGLPLGGVTVSAQGLSTVSAASGAYRLESLRTGSTTVSATKSGYQAFQQSVSLILGDNTLDIQMSAATGTAILSGTVASSSGPVSGVTLSIQGKTTTSASDGSYILTNLTPSTSSLTATKSGFQNFQQNVTLAAGQNTIDITMTETTATLTGVVQKGDGTPIAGATVTARGVSATSDASGIYRITGLPLGSATVSATATGFHSFTTTTTLVAGQNTLDIVMAP